MVRVAPLVVGKQTRKQKRAMNRRADELRKQYRQEQAEKRRQVKEAEKTIWAGDYLPASGEWGDRTGRNPVPINVHTNRYTTKTLQVQYPFFAEEGLGPGGILIGRNVISSTSFSFDPFELYRRRVLSNTNMAVLGKAGSAKSSLMKTFALRAWCFGQRTFIPGDVKGEWSKVVRSVGGNVISIGGSSRARLNPLDAGTRPERDEDGQILDDEQWARTVKSQRTRLVAALTSSLMNRDLNQDEQTALDAALEATAARGGTPILPTVVDELFDPSGVVPLPRGPRNKDELITMGHEVALALQRLVRGDLAGLFDGPSTVRFDPAAPMMSVNLKAFAVQDPALPLIMTCTSTWLEAALRGATSLGQRYIIYDEAHRLLALPGLASRMRDQFKLTRAWGTANVLVLHRLSDLEAIGDAGSAARAIAQGLLADTSTKIIYRQEPEELDALRETFRMSDVAANYVSMLNIGVGLWMVDRQLFMVEHQRTPWEAELTDTDEAMGGRP